MYVLKGIALVRDFAWLEGSGATGPLLVYVYSMEYVDIYHTILVTMFDGSMICLNRWDGHLVNLTPGKNYTFGVSTTGAVRFYLHSWKLVGKNIYIYTYTYIYISYSLSTTLHWLLMHMCCGMSPCVC